MQPRPFLVVVNDNIWPFMELKVQYGGGGDGSGDLTILTVAQLCIFIVLTICCVYFRVFTEVTFCNSADFISADFRRNSNV